MTSMGYCQFRNALSDLHEAERMLNDTGGSFDHLSPEERKAAERLINLCRKIGEEWGEQ